MPIFFLIFLKAKTISDFFSDPLLFSYTIFVTTFEISRLLVATLLYKSNTSDIVARDEEKYEPVVSFVIPCKNEEAAIENTVRKCFSVDYPKEKLEVIVINDGSTDRTGEILDNLK